MRIKQKISIAFVACLLFAQNTHGMGSLPPLFPSLKEVCGTIMQLGGLLLSFDGIADASGVVSLGAVLCEREQLVKNGLKLTPELGVAELIKRATQLVPNSIPTDPKVRVCKTLVGVAFMVGGHWLRTSEKK